MNTEKLKNITKKAFNIATWVVLLFLAFVAVSLILSSFENTPFRFKVYNVQSGSMEPSIHIGSLVFVTPQSSYSIGDVVTYRSKKTIKDTFTHRIIGIEDDSDIGKFYYRTKGDANEEEDITPVYPNLVLGKVAFNVPVLGYPLAFAKTQLGFILLIVIPATLIIYSELGNVKKEIVAMLEQRKKDRPKVVSKPRKKKDDVTE